MDETRSALIVASDKYTDPGLRRLRAPASDARALAAVLRDPGIGGFEVRTLLNEPAHLINLAVEEFFADRRPGDLLLVHFSGHGVKDEDGELYFAASNTVLGRLGATAVAAEFVSRRMSRSRSRRVVLLLDCCYAGAFERGLTARAGTDMGIEQHFGGRGRAVITASSAMEYAFEVDELTSTVEGPPSIFTSALVQGLETGDADQDQDGLVGLDELYDYVYDKVRAITPNQTPGKWTFGMEGELYIAHRSRPVTGPAVLPAELQQAIDSPLARIRTGAVQELAEILRGRHAGKALAARLALEGLTGDDSRAVAAAAATALGGQVAPELALPVTSIDFGPLPEHRRSPERRIQLRNAGGGALNARATTSAAWLKVSQAGDELVVAADTSKAGQYEGTVTIDTDGGTGTIRARAEIVPAPPPLPAIATTQPEPAPDAALGVWPRQLQDLVLADAPSGAALAVPPVTDTTAALTNPAAAQAAAGVNADPVTTAGRTEPSHLSGAPPGPSAAAQTMHGSTGKQIPPRGRNGRSRLGHFGAVKTVIAAAVVVVAAGSVLAVWLAQPTSPRVTLPAVSGIAPARGTNAGGTTVAITGTGLADAAAVTFGGTAAAITADSGTQITVTSPPGTGTVDITVTTPAGTSTATTLDRFTYTSTARPSVTRVFPARGTTGGGTSVTIFGTGLAGATAVRFGGTTATITADSGTRLTVNSPRGNGRVDITVTTPAGTSTATTADRFTYTVPTGTGNTGTGNTVTVQPPTVTGVSTKSGPTAGGTSVTITGTNLANAKNVSFGGAAGSITADSSTQITVTSPAGSGTVNITVTTPGGTVTAGQFTYLIPAPTITTLSPDSGIGCGGTTVDITGSNLSNASSVSFGGTAGTITSDSSTEIVVTAPAGSGTVTITVTTPGGTATGSFTYSACIQ